MISRAAAAAMPTSVDQMPPQALSLDGEAVFDRAALLDRLLDEPLDQLRRRAEIAAGRQTGGLDRAQDGGLQRRVALLEIQRDLRVGDASEQRPDEPEPHQAGEDDEGRDAERDDGGRAEPERFETRRRQQQRQQRAGHDDDRSAQRQPHPPAVADTTDDVDELETTVGR